MAKRHRTLGPNVIIKMETGEIKSESGFIIATGESRESTAREEAVIESMGEDAFSDLKDENKPQVGDKVVISRYSGKTLGTYPEDKQERRVIADTGILAVILEE